MKPRKSIPSPKTHGGAAGKEAAAAENDRLIAQPGFLRKAAMYAGAFLALGGVIGQIANTRENRDRIEQLEAKTNAASARQAALEERLRRLAGLAGREYGVDPAVVSGENLRQPDALPGNAASVPDRVRRSVAKATLLIGEQPKAAPKGKIDIGCTATKIALSGANYVLTAAHCIKSDLPNEKAEIAYQAVNVTERSDKTYYALDQTGTPIARADSVAIDTASIADLALLRVPAGNAAFDAIPALDAADISYPRRTPEQGSPVELYSFPGSANGVTPIVDTGVYLGRTTASGATTGREMDAVGINPAKANTDACFYGASGSAAAFSNGTISGPLSWRSHIGYGPDAYFEPPDRDYASTVLKARFRLEADLKVDTSGFTTVCFFSVPPGEESIQQLAAAVQNPTHVWPSYVK